MKNAIDKVGCSTLSKAALTAVILASMTMGANAADTTYQLDEVVVTATKTENTIKDVPEATEVFTQKDFKQLGAQDVRDALKLATNVDVGEAGMTGNQVSLRGMSSSHTLVLIDGKRMASEDTSETINAYELNRINLSNVDRIEVVRGNSSALYGSDALGGVINIITKRPAEEGLTVGANTGSREMNNYYHYDFGQIGKFNGSIDANFQKVRRFSWNDDNTTTMYGPRQNFAFNGEYKLAENRTVGLDLEWMKDHMRMDYEDAAFSMGPTFSLPTAKNKYQTIDSERKSVALDYHAKTTASDFMIRTYFNRLEKENNTYNMVRRTGQNITIPLPSGGTMSLSQTEYIDHLELFDYDRAKYDTFVVEARDTTKLSDEHRITVGSDYRYLKYKGSRLNAGDKDWTSDQNELKTPTEKEMNFASAYIQDEWTPSEKWLIIPSVRYDHSDKFGSNVAPKIGVTYKFSDHLRVKANYGRGFRAPTLSELYMYFDGQSMTGQPLNFYITGNPDLKPEKSLGYDFSIEGEFGKTFGSISYFHNKVNNLITSKPVENLPYSLYEYRNVGLAKLEGVEAAFGVHLNDYWTLKGTWNYLDSYDSEDKTRVIGTGQNYGTLQLLYDNSQNNGISGVLWYQFMSDYYAGSSREAGSGIYNYHTWNFSVNKKWNEHLSTFFGIDNILNDAVPDVAIAGRLWRTGVEWKF